MGDDDDDDDGPPPPPDGDDDDDDDDEPPEPPTGDDDDDDDVDTESPPVVVPCMTVTDYICNMDPKVHNLTMICDYLTIWVPKLGPALDDGLVLEDGSVSSFTLFAPTNEGFEHIQQGLGTLSSEHVLATILFHLQPNTIMTWEDYVCTETYDMASEQKSRSMCYTEPGLMAKAQKGGGNQKHGTTPWIIDRNNKVCHGMVQIVDEVMLPNFVTMEDLLQYNYTEPQQQKIDVAKAALFSTVKETVRPDMVLPDDDDDDDDDGSPPPPAGGDDDDDDDDDG